MAADIIQQRINDNIADVPVFYGQPEKDTITLKYYVWRIYQGVTALKWTQANTFVAFKNSVKGPAGDWLNSFLALNRAMAQEWNVVKPYFHKAFETERTPWSSPIQCSTSNSQATTTISTHTFPKSSINISVINKWETIILYKWHIFSHFNTLWGPWCVDSTEDAYLEGT